MKDFSRKGFVVITGNTCVEERLAAASLWDLDASEEESRSWASKDTSLYQLFEVILDINLVTIKDLGPQVDEFKLEEGFKFLRYGFAMHCMVEPFEADVPADLQYDIVDNQLEKIISDALRKNPFKESYFKVGLSYRKV